MQTKTFIQLFFALLLFTSGRLYAGIIGTSNVISTPSGGTPAVVTGGMYATSSVTVAPSVYPYTDRLVQGTLTFGVNHRYGKTFASSNIKIQVFVKGWADEDDVTPSMLDTIIMDISYSPGDSLNFRDRHSVMISGVRKYEATITKVWVNGTLTTILPANLTLQLAMAADRYYDDFPINALSPIVMNTAETIDFDCDEVDDQIVLSWPGVVGAEEYQLEWMYVNYYGDGPGTELDAEDLFYDFKRNSTRVSVVDPHYALTLAFDKGYICYRVRAIGRDVADLTQIIFGVWSTPDAGAVDGLTSKYKNDVAYEAGKNWQYSTTYAEEGKKKEVVSFFDGSLRNRQMVTKVNTDNNTIVGETIYDHMGRPAVQVLPVPVDDPSCAVPGSNAALKFYPNFTQNGAGNAYSRVDFDVNEGGDTCNIATSGMGTDNGAARYYSSDNPDMGGAQSYVPDAAGYPFTQVEYMPDNTGRIRRQAGVGADFKLGNGHEPSHETKYFYGHPSQVELDRMFGSEVGDYLHYQKNMVVDPNGQTSVSYLDQEGRVIATSLAGTAPENLVALDDAETSAVLTENLLATNNLGVSGTNELLQDGKTKQLNQTMVISAETDVAITYDLDVATLDDPCFAEGVCMSCIYDLTINILDDCGLDLTEDLGFAEKKMIGNFTVNGEGGLEFSTHCTASDFGLPARDTIHLMTGTYQIVKTLTVNEEALAYYVDSIFLDPEFNICLKTLDDFETEYLEATNFDDCMPVTDCDACLASIGTAAQFIANGLGTLEEYNTAVVACTAPCETASMSEAYLDMLQMDMSPAGQYAEYLNADGEYVYSMYPVSILNSANVLPRSASGGVKTWRNPKLIDPNNVEHDGYFEEDQTTRSQIRVERVFDPVTGAVTGCVPAAESVSDIHLDLSTGDYYIYPEDLADIALFINTYWKESWAHSLVQYHPEFPMYEIYSGYTKPVTAGDAWTSESFDDLLRNTSTFGDAVTKGLISGGAVTNWFATSSSIPWDPFVVYSAGYDGYGAQLSARFATYSPGLSMVDVAAATTRCGNTLIGASSFTGCINFGTGGVTEILDEEWNKLVGLYLSAKFELQSQRAIAISVNDPAYLGYNACIGNPDFNPLENGFSDFINPMAPHSAYVNPSQPCNSVSRYYYEHKEKRFPMATDLSSDFNDAAYQHYLLTGQSPIAANLQYFLNETVTTGQLTDASFTASDLSTYGGFYLANHNNVVSTVPTTTWTQTVLTTTSPYDLEADLTSTDPTGTIRLTRPAELITLPETVTTAEVTAPFDWTDITSLHGLQYLSTVGSNHLFKVTATVELSDIEYLVTLTGSTTYDIGDYTYEETCQPNDLAVDISTLLDALATTNLINSTTAVSIGGGTAYEALSTPLILAQASSGTTPDLYFEYGSGLPGFKIYESTGSNIKLQLQIISSGAFSLADLGDIKSFSGITYTGTPNSHTFVLHGLDALGVPLADLECTAVHYNSSAVASNIPLGTCALPNPSWCDGPQYTNLPELADLIYDVIKVQSSATPGYNIYASSFMTPELLAQLPSGISNTTSTSHSVLESGLYYDTTTIKIRNSCPIVLTNTSQTAYAIHAIENILDVQPWGGTDEWGNYHAFYMLASFDTGLLKYTDTIFVKSCFPVNLCGTAPVSVDTEIEFPTGVFEDPCTDYLTGIAYANALNAWNNYMDGLRSEITQKYINHCMGAVETFTKTWTDNEYHRTLYYYDQAGNLVKTVPPEGVELLNITSDTDPLEVLVKADRTNGTHQVLTAHRMPTIYEYNSLNQLVRQSVPDQDPVNLWEISMPDGLQAGLTTTAIQMINANTGYLTGWVSISGKVRGFLYRTDNGGNNWTKVDNTVAADLKKIQMVDADTGYAVGSSGVALRTIDGGLNWDMLNTYGSSVVADLNDLYFSSTTAGRFVGKNGVEVITSNAGSTFTVSATIIPTGYTGSTIDNIRSIEPFGSSFLYAVTVNTSGTLYDIITTGASTHVWTAQTIQGADYHAIHFYDANNGIIAGADGNLVSAYVPTTGTAYVQTNLVSGITNKILRVFFVNASRGIALVESGSNKALMYTIDKGVSWSPVENAQESYGDLQLYAQTFSTSIELIAVGADGHTDRIVMTSTVLPHIIDQTNYAAPQLLDLTSAQVVDDGTGKRIIAGTLDGKVYYSTLLGNGSQPVTYTLISTLASGHATKILLSYYSSTGGITGIILTSTGKVYPLTRASSSPSYSLGSYLGLSTAVFADITGTGNITYAYNAFANRIYRIDLSSSGASATLLSNTVADSPVITAIGVSQGGRVTFAGTSGEIRTVPTDISTGNPGGTWAVHTNLRMTPIYDLHFISGDDVLAAGGNGVLMKRLTYSSSLIFMITPLGLTHDLRVVKPNGSDYVLAGSGGFAAGYTYLTNVTTPFVLSNGQLTTSHFSNTTFKDAGASGTNVYFAGTGGTVLYSPDAATNFFTFTSVPNVDFNGLSITPGQTGSFVKMYAVGTASKIYRFTGTSGVQVKQVFSDTLYDVHFADNSTGTVIGKGYFARQTLDGGNTWKIVLPSSTTHLAQKLSTAWTMPNGYALIAGNGYFASVTDQVATITSTYSESFRDIEFASNSPLEGWVATANRVRKITLTPAGTNSYTHSVSSLYLSTGAAVNAIHVFENGGVITAGNGLVMYMKPGGTTSTAWVNVTPPVAGITYKDVYFHDDATGYLVGTNGTNGVIMHTTTVGYAIASTREIGSIAWTSKLYTADEIATATANVSTINSIAFGSRHEGVWGGSYASAFTATNHTAYLRKVHDESDEFSSQFFYDRLGRLVVSQNSRQHAANTMKYSYSLYDPLGRVYEAGEKTENSTGASFASIFGTMVNDIYNPKVIDDTKLDDWITGDGPRREVTRSYYDATVITGLPAGFTPDVRTQRKRITHVTYEAVYDADDQSFDHATHYDYDIHGNVKTLLQDNQQMADLDVNLATQRYKRMDYVYDLISGNVHRVSYQTGKADQWHHAYSYDADNRIIDVRTSQATPFIDPVYGTPTLMNETVGPYWDREARYQYYAHGPLARTVLGAERVQGTDYTYTLQGWLKGVNSTALDPANDPNGDGTSTAQAARDVYSYGLHYYHDDYASIGGNNPFGVQDGGDDLSYNSDDLYNGNIARMVTTITNPTSRDVLPLGNAYQYDQLNRLKESRSFTTFDPVHYKWEAHATYNNMYYNAFTFDRNGNIMTQKRRNESGTRIDSLSYNYPMVNGKKVQNRLYAVDDAVSSGAFADDIDDMAGVVGTDINLGAREMVYDEGTEWTSASSIPGGSVNILSTNDPKVGTYCAAYDDLDATGYLGFQRSSAISVAAYNYVTFFVRNRTAMDPASLPYLYISLNTTAYVTINLLSYGYSRDMVGEWQPISIPISTMTIPGSVNRIRMRLQGTVPTDMDFDIDQLMFTEDAYPNIVPLGNYAYDEEGRLVRDGQEGIAKIDWRVDGKVLKITRPGGSAKKNLIFDYDAMGNRIAKHVLTSADVLEKSTYYVLDASGNTMSVYERTVDEEAESVEFYQAEKHIYGSSRLGVMEEKIPLLGSQNSTYSMQNFWHRTGLRNYELNNHLGNVLSVISDKIIPVDEGTPDGGVVDYYVADIRTAQDYSPFGVTLSGRNFTLAGAEEFRYGYQGSEKDDEVKGEGNSYDYGARMLDPRIGRWLTIDRFKDKYPSMSPYSFVGNNPVVFKDINGDTLIVAGSYEEWVKFEAVLEASFSGEIDFERNDQNMVTMKMDGKELLVDQTTLGAILQYHTEKVEYKLLAAAIDPASKTTRIELVGESERSMVSGGSFRGVEKYGPNGKVQMIDMEDMLVRGNTRYINTMSVLMHELYEAYNDQVVNGSPIALKKEDRYPIFLPVHNGALKLQAQMGGVDIVGGISFAPGNGRAAESWQITGIEKPDGGYFWTIAIFKEIGGNFTKIAEYSDDDAYITVEFNDKGEISGANIGDIYEKD